MRRRAILLVAVALVAGAGCSDDEPAARRPSASTTTTSAPVAPPETTTTLPPGPTLPELPVALELTMNELPYSLQATQLVFPAYRVDPTGGTTLAWDLAGAPTGSFTSSGDPRTLPPDTEVRIGAVLTPPSAEAAGVLVPPGGNDTAAGWCTPASDPGVIGTTAADTWSAFASANGIAGDLVCGSLWAAAVGRGPELLGPTSGSAPQTAPAAAAEAFARHIAPANVVAYVVALGTGGFSFLGTCAVLLRPGASPVLYDPKGSCGLR